MNMKQNRTRIVLELGMALAFFLTVLLTAAVQQYRAACQAVCADTLRLHILANSDTDADQALKLRVRDAVAEYLAPRLRHTATKAQAVAAVTAALPGVRSTAQSVVRGDQRVTVRLEEMKFAPKDYGAFRLPGGRYTALRIELGAAAGHNWFCVLYPGMCLGSAAARYDAPAENAVVFGQYEIRSALWDTLRGAVVEKRAVSML